MQLCIGILWAMHPQIHSTDRIQKLHESFSIYIAPRWKCTGYCIHCGSSTGTDILEKKVLSFSLACLKCELFRSGNVLMSTGKFCEGNDLGDSLILLHNTPTLHWLYFVCMLHFCNNRCLSTLSSKRSLHSLVVGYCCSLCSCRIMLET